MKKLIYSIALVSCLTLQVSCLTTVQSLVTAKNIITDERITGTWQYDKGAIEIKRSVDTSMQGDINNHRIDPRNFIEKQSPDSAFYEKNYTIYFESKGIAHTMVGSIVSINNALFIELSPILIDDPQRPDGSGYELSYNYMPTFTIAKLIFNGNRSLDLQFLNGDYIKEQIDAGNMRIKHEKDRLFNTFVITASSDELSHFFEKYGNNDRLFSPKNSITLIRKG